MLATHTAPRFLAWGLLPRLISVSLRDGEEVQACRSWTVNTFAPIAAALCVTVPNVTKWSISARGVIGGTDTARIAAVAELDDGASGSPGSVTSARPADACSMPDDRQPTALASGRWLRK